MSKIDISELIDFVFGVDGHDPANFDKYRVMDANELKTSLNEKKTPGVRPLIYSELIAWAAQGADDGKSVPSRYERIEDGIQHASGAIRGVCKAAVKLLETPGMSLDLNLPDRAALVGALNAEGVKILTDEDVVSLQSEASVTLSDVEVLFGYGAKVSSSVCNGLVSALDKEEVRRGV